MEKMRFHWENSEGKTGTFTVTAATIELCMKIAKEEIGENEMTDWYSI